MFAATLPFITQEVKELFAEWGWESHAISLPGHAKSSKQRSIINCTLDYYLSFIKDEIERLNKPPVLMGHSMGGALTQWYLKYLGDLPAAILVAPWSSHSIMRDALIGMLKLDMTGSLMAMFKWHAGGFVRNPEQAAKKLISENALKECFPV